MGSYVESVLASGEQVLHQGRVSAWSQFWWWFAGVLLLPAFGIGLILWGIAWVRMRTTELAVTNRRVIAKFGLIRRDTIEIQVARIESVQVHQSVTGRVLGFGTIVFSGAGTPQVSIPQIADPLGFRKAVVGAQEGGAGRPKPA
jgi:uncharacterized membrane protein YdbT with pleckstrin-like domain